MHLPSRRRKREDTTVMDEGSLLVEEDAPPDDAWELAQALEACGGPAKRIRKEIPVALAPIQVLDPCPLCCPGVDCVVGGCSGGKQTEPRPRWISPVGQTALIQCSACSFALDLTSAGIGCFDAARKVVEQLQFHRALRCCRLKCSQQPVFGTVFLSKETPMGLIDEASLDCLTSQALIAGTQGGDVEAVIGDLVRGIANANGNGRHVFLILNCPHCGAKDIVL